MLIAHPDGFLPALVRGLAALEDSKIPRHALVGGVAVMIRLSQAHRATQDLDEVVEPSSPSAAVLIGGVGSPEHRVVTPAGVRIDLISVGDRPMAELHPDELPDDDSQRLLLLAHDHALRTAELRAGPRQRPRRRPHHRDYDPGRDRRSTVRDQASSRPRPLRTGADQTRERLCTTPYCSWTSSAPEPWPTGCGPDRTTSPPLVAALTRRLLDDNAERSMRWATDAGITATAAGMTPAAARALADELVPLLAT